MKKLLQLLIMALIFTAAAQGIAANQHLVLLLPDGQNLTDTRVTVWLDAIQEEGFLVRVMHDKDFISAVAKGTITGGVILPDQVHPRASDALISAITTFVARGGKIMLVYDFGVRTEKGHVTPKSRLSGIAGIDYALDYPKTVFGPIVGMADTMRELQIPPGKTMDYKGALPLSPVSLSQAAGTSSSSIYPSTIIPQAISGYVYGIINYYNLIAAKDYSGRALLVSPANGFAAGITDSGKGKLLFVNIPLGFFAGRTDAMLLRGFLYYFGVEMLKLPRLSGFPDARGGLVLNWHLDAKFLYPSLLDIEKAISTLDKFDVWDRGVFSIHITAGPDTNKIGDGLGLDIPNNQVMQKWITLFKEKGHAIGSHGGWIHNHYGYSATENNSDEFLKYLILNAEAIKKVTGEKSLEYSAPCGNNPRWAMDWLERQGVIAYYYVGDTGCAPRRSYCDGIMANPKMWAFSVTPLGEYAVWEEFDAHNIAEKNVEQWYKDLIDFVVHYRSVRLIYMHPLFAQYHRSVLNNLFDRADFYAKQNLFRWYKMADLGEFQNSRLKTNWKIIDISEGHYRFEATNPVSLKTMSWLLPKSIFKENPIIISGQGTITSDTDNWIVTATEGKLLKFTVVHGN